MSTIRPQSSVKLIESDKKIILSEEKFEARLDNHQKTESILSSLGVPESLESRSRTLQLLSIGTQVTLFGHKRTE